MLNSLPLRQSPNVTEAGWKATGLKFRVKVRVRVKVMSRVSAAPSDASRDWDSGK